MNTTRDRQLMDDVMRRVRFIHGLRLLMSPQIVKATVLAVSIACSVFLVSIPHIVENMSHLSVRSYAPYIMNAYLHTDLAVQAIVLLALAAGLWLARDILRSWSMQRSLQLS